MQYAYVVPDIGTRAVSDPYSYAVPAALSAVEIGCTVLITFAGRPAVGYVVALTQKPPADLDPRKIRPIERILAPAAFDAVSAELAVWMAHTYAAPLSDCLRLMLPPGQSIRMRRADKHSPWELAQDTPHAVDDRWVGLTPAAQDYTPRASASRQRAVIAALAQGTMRLAELSATIDGAASVVSSLAKKGIVSVEHRRHVRGLDTTTTLSSASSSRPEVLTLGQQQALAAIQRAVDAAAGDVVLVDGVTGSGKTEVYLSAIEQVLARGLGALVLVPEISLTAQTVGRFRSRFGDAVAVLHSRLSVGERFDQWDMVRSGQAQVVVGARSALFAPLTKVGLIVIDEEHEPSYKQDSSPRYHAREVAAHLAELRGAACVLGSATPSVESLARCKQSQPDHPSWTAVSMPERPGTATLPDVQVVDMRTQFASGNRQIFSAPLRDALLELPSAGEKGVLMLNRRGFANFLMCRECGCVPECPHCSTALTYHERGHLLMCHTCGRSWPMRAWPDPTTRCPNCGSRYLAQFGLGTQRVEDELRMLLGDTVEIIRMDADTTRTKGAHQKLLEQFDAARSAVLVGTQMIAKGLDFPEVTLVGVINADTTLKLPDFRAAERTYDLLEQVSGRAGRGTRPGKVIIQTYWSTHPAIQAAATHTRSTFLDAELQARQEAYYPPFSRVSNIVVWGPSEAEVKHISFELAEELRRTTAALDGWRILGPAECVRAKAKDKWRRHVLIKSPTTSDPGPILSAATAKLSVKKGSSIAIDVDAYDLL